MAVCVKGVGEILPGVFGEQEDQIAWSGESQGRDMAVE